MGEAPSNDAATVRRFRPGGRAHPFGAALDRRRAGEGRPTTLRLNPPPGLNWRTAGAPATAH